MRRDRSRLATVLLAVVSVAALTLGLVAAPATARTGDREATAARRAPADLADQLRALPRVQKVTEATAPAGYRFFLIDFRQQVDHTKPGKGTFTQRLTLLHKDVGRPMVMYTSGYNVSQTPRRSEPTQIVDGNQLSMEYRFFDPSRPDHPQWSKQLTIWQAATDQHLIISSFKHLYQQRWLTTGGSKGGMTATYHRRFYPRDVSGTVPYVAPNDVVDSQDVYNEFLAQVGDPQCRDTLTGLQRRALTDRQWFVAKARADSQSNGYTYSIVGSLGKAVEAAVVDTYFAFWQYSLQSDCASLPDPATATNDQVWDFFEQVEPLTTYSDQGLEPYVPYYFQAAYQLGSPEPYEDRLSDLLRFPGSDVAVTFVPKTIRPRHFDTSAMPDIDRWVRTRSRHMLYVYGGNDPWGAEPFRCGAGAAQRQCARYVVAGGNHGSTIAQLPDDERIRATALVLQWAGLGDGDRAVRRIDAAGRPLRNKALDRSPDYLRQPGR